MKLSASQLVAEGKKKGHFYRVKPGDIFNEG